MVDLNAGESSKAIMYTEENLIVIYYFRNTVMKSFFYVSLLTLLFLIIH